MDERIYTFNKVVIDTVYNIICAIYPVTGSKRDFARFYVLETVARVPYFAYLSVMHLRETFGERDPKLGERMRTHYAEADNELHHLLIMESLGGNSSIVDRTIGSNSHPNKLFSLLPRPSSGPNACHYTATALFLEAHAILTAGETHNSTDHGVWVLLVRHCRLQRLRARRIPLV